ncbi:MAG TPA: DUF2283 domain-containing protein, partial [Anaerolineae bacterium]|nr:DUF2283 domain-containing protein [Anaerolineae bacterium]
AMNVHLTEHILLRLQPQTKTAIGLMLLDFSVLMQPTEAGLRSFPLTELNQLPGDLKETVLELLTSPPVNRFLTTSLYIPKAGDPIPLVHLEISAFSVPA